MTRTAAETIYTLGLHALRPALAAIGRRSGDGKLVRGVQGRQGVLERIRAWSEAERDPARKLLWFHAPSVGEGLQARAVIQALRLLHPEVQVAYTYFSASAISFAASIEADFTDFLPWDLPGDAARALDLIRPAALVFSKTDVWPNLTLEAHRRGIPTLLVSGTLPASSSRMGIGARALLGPAYRRLTRVAAISAADADRFGRLGVPDSRRTVMGDARFDQVLERASRAGQTPWVRRLSTDARFVIVAGSTWTPDERVLIAALAAARPWDPPLRLVIAPHEPTPDHLAAIEERLRAAGFSSQRLADVAEGPVTADVVLVDRVGVLGDLYAVGDLAYVGGGWGTAGLHSVLEPAAFGLPVLFGPRHDNAREAADLIEVGGAFAVTGEEELQRRIVARREGGAARHAAGEAAAAYVAAGRGAAARGAELVAEAAGL